MSEINIECGEVVDISKVSEMYQRLNEALEQEGPVSLHAGAFERIDTAALQMFVSFFQEVKKRHRDVSWKAPTEVLLRSAKFLGMSQILLLEE